MMTVAAGCAAKDPSTDTIMSELENIEKIADDEFNPDYPTDHMDMWRMVDEEAGVVLYVTNEYGEGGGGVTAIPKEATDL